jgi:hypothetical protein
VNRDERRTFRVTYAAWLFGIVAYFLPAATWNPVSRFDLTRAVVEDGTLSIDRFVSNTGDRSLVHGHWYTDKPPLVSFAAVPVYVLVHAVQHLRGAAPEAHVLGTDAHPAVRVTPNRAFQQGFYACSLATSGVSGVLIGLGLFELLRRRMSSGTALASATLVVLGTPIFPYATSFYSHVPAAALLLWAVVCLDQRGVRPVGALPSLQRMRWAGACLALAPGCEYLTLFPAALIGLWFVLDARQSDRLVVARELALGGLAPALALAAYHAAAFGAPWRTGYSFMTKPEFVAGHASGVLGIHTPTLAGSYGLLLGVRRGLFYVSPLAVFGVMFGIQHARRRKDLAFGAGLAALGALFALNAGYYMWWGGAAAGPRHLVPGLAFLAVGVAVGLRLRFRWARVLTVVLGLVSIANMLALTAVGMEAPELGDILGSYAWPQLLAGRLADRAGASNLGVKLGLGGLASLVPLILWGVGGFAYLHGRVGTRYPRLSR